MRFGQVIICDNCKECGRFPRSGVTLKCNACGYEQYAPIEKGDMIVFESDEFYSVPYLSVDFSLLGMATQSIQSEPIDVILKNRN